MAGQRERFAREQQDHDAHVKELEKEVKDLEWRKEKALEPVKLIEERAERELKSALGILDKAKEREQEANELNELLQDKLDAVGQREQDVRLKEQKLGIREENVKTSEKWAKETSKKAQDQMTSFLATMVKMNTELQEGRKALALDQRSLEAQKSLNTLKEKELKAWEIRLKDERGTLDRIHIRNQNAQK